MSILDKKDNLKKLMKDVKSYKGAYVKVGIQNNAGFNIDGTSILDYAQYNEFGTTHIPERSFIRSTEEEKRKDWYSLLEKGLEDLLDGNSSALRALSLVGLKAVDDIKLKITNAKNDPNIPALKPSTIKAKKSTSPLIDTGALRNSVRYVVENI